MPERLSAVDSVFENLSEAEAEAQAAFELWAPSHAIYPLCVLPYDLAKYPRQRFDILSQEARPNLDIARYAGETGMDPAGYRRLVDTFVKLNILEDLEAKANSGVSSLVATAHLKNVLDTAIVHNAMFVASGKEDFAHRNVIVANPMMKRLGIDFSGVVYPVTDVLSIAGRVIFAMPDAAEKYGLSKEVISQYGRASGRVLKEASEQGSVIHWALSGTRAKENGGSKLIPRVDDSVAFIAKKRTPNALGVVIDLDGPGNPSRVLPIRTLSSVEDVHTLMNELAGATSEITGSRVIYGE